VWVEKTDGEIRESVKIRTLWKLKTFREKLRIAKLKVNNK
jgi:hypothetical protein